MDHAPTSPDCLQLFNVGDDDELVQALREISRQRGVTFAAPRTFEPDRCERPARSLHDGRPIDGRPAATGTAAALPGADAALPGSDAARPVTDTAPDRGALRPNGRPQTAQAPVPVWRWHGTDRDLLKCARQVLNETVYPLAATGRPFCLAWPFDESFLAPRRLTVTERHLLDLEDIGVLAGGACAVPLAPVAQAADLLEDLDPDQRTAAAHGGGPARVLAAAGSGKTKTMVARVATLVRRGVPPGAILVLAFNTEAAVQLEERLGALGIPTTRKIAAGAGGVHCATFNAFGQRFQRHVLGGAPAVRVDPTARERLLRAALRAEAAVEAVLHP
jgi:hypothetical protein